MPIRVLRCSACHQRWGDDEAGGCETVLLAREVVALRERAERAERAVAWWNREWEALDGLLRTVCDAVIDVAYWRSKRNGRRQRRAVAVLEDMVRAALRDGG